MSKIIRKAQKLFGSNASANQIAKFGSLAAGSPTRYSGVTADPDNIQALSNYLGGWFSAVLGLNSPAVEDFNAVDYLFSYQLAYLLQQGVAEWNTDTFYYQGSIVSDGLVNATLYVSLTDDNQGNALSDGSNWATLSTGGSVKAKAVNYQILPGDSFIKVSANHTETLPDATLVTGREYTLKKTDFNATTVTIATLLSQTIDESSTYSLVEQYQFVTVRSDGVNWWIVAAG